MKITVGIGATRASTIEAAACSVWRQTWTDWELIIVGQGPGHDPAARRLRAAGERLQAGDARIKYIHLAEMGLSRARNEAIRRAQGDVIAFIDDDCEAAPDWLAVIAACLLADPSLDVVGGALVAGALVGGGVSACPVLEPTETLYDAAARPHDPPPGWDWVGANVALRTEAALRIGLFDECLGPGAIFLSGEDTDYKLRAEALGLRMLATPRSVVRHTYGRRVGAQAVAGLSRAYARGAGAVAGKLTTAGDLRGAAWVAAAHRQFWRDAIRPRRAVAAFYRLPHFLRAYREVVAAYTVDPRTGCLQPKPADIGRATSLGRSATLPGGASRGGSKCDACSG